MELSQYDLMTNKENRVNKSVPMSKELSQKINATLRMMPNTDFSKATREMWVRLILSMGDAGYFKDLPETIQVHKISQQYFRDQNPFVRKNLTGGAS